jgi:putative ABC transport system permease protein
VAHLIAVNLRRHRGRTLLTAAGIATGVAAVVALLSLTAGLERSARGLVNLGGAELGLFQGGTVDLTASSLPVELAERAERVEGVAEAAPVAVLTEEVEDGSLLVFGVPLDSFMMRRLVVVEGGRPVGDAAMLGDGAADELRLGAGDALDLAGERVPVTGIYHVGVPFEDQGAAVPLSLVQRLAGRERDVTTIAVSVEAGAETGEVAERLTRRFPGTVAISEPGQAARLDSSSLLVSKAALVIAVLALAIGAVAVMNTMLMAVLERRREFALMAAVGWSRGRIARLVLGESLALGVVGAVAGVVLGVVAAELLVRLLATSALIVPDVTAWGLARAAAIGLGIAVAGALYPAWRVSRLSPAQALA